MSRGVRVTAVVIDPSSFGMPYNSLDVEIELIASHIPHYVVHQGDALEQVLTTTRTTR
jgi:hypothetical protein